MTRPPFGVLAIARRSRWLRRRRTQDCVTYLDQSARGNDITFMVPPPKPGPVSTPTASAEVRLLRSGPDAQRTRSAWLSAPAPRVSSARAYGESATSPRPRVWLSGARRAVRTQQHALPTLHGDRGDEARGVSARLRAKNRLEKAKEAKDSRLHRAFAAPAHRRALCCADGVGVGFRAGRAPPGLVRALLDEKAGGTPAGTPTRTSHDEMKSERKGRGAGPAAFAHTNSAGSWAAGGRA